MQNAQPPPHPTHLRTSLIFKAWLRPCPQYVLLSMTCTDKTRQQTFSFFSCICHNTQRYMTTSSLFPIYPYLTLLLFCFCLLFPIWVVLGLSSRMLRLYILLHVIARINTWMTYCIIGIALMQKIDLCINMSQCKLCTIYHLDYWCCFCSWRLHRDQ